GAGRARQRQGRRREARGHAARGRALRRHGLRARRRGEAPRHRGGEGDVSEGEEGEDGPRRARRGDERAQERAHGVDGLMRPLWTGAISFGLVNVPVSLYSATRHHSLDFDMLDRRDMQPVGYQRINKETGKPVSWEQVVKGYEYEKGRYVVLTDADFKAANVEATQTIDIVSFVDVHEIPVVYFDTPYYLAPARGGAKGYSLLLETLEHADKAAIGQVVIRTRQHLSAILPDKGLLVLCTLRYGYEIRARDGM